MKKNLVMMMLVLLCGTGVMYAQGPRGPRPQMNPEQMAKMRTERIVKKYGLNEEQQKKLEALNKEQAEQMKVPRIRPVPKDSLEAMSKKERKAYKAKMEKQREEMKAERQKKEAEYQAALKKILTSEQYAQYQKDEEAMKQRRGQMGPRGGRGQGWGNRPNNGGGMDDDDF